MIANSMDNHAHSFDYSVTEQQPNANNQQDQNTNRNQSNALSLATVTKKTKKTAMTPTPLEYSCWSTHPLSAATSVFIVFIFLTMMIAVPAVCFASQNFTVRKCNLQFKKTENNPIAYNTRPRSVAVGDFNNDSWLDIVVANSQFGNIEIFFGSGNETFSNKKTYFTGSDSRPYSIAVAYIDNDTILDIAVANFAINSIDIFFGLGDG
ncbi:unnamed protein product, partial [Rotaria magnacalcarata]